MKKVSVFALFSALICVVASVKFFLQASQTHDVVFSSSLPEQDSVGGNRQPNQVTSTSTVNLIDENSTGRKIKLNSQTRQAPFFEPDPRLLVAHRSKWIGAQWRVLDQATFKASNLLRENDPRLYDLDRYSIVTSATPSRFQLFQPDTPLVLYDSLKKQFGLLTGTVIVTYIDEEFVENVKRQKNIEVIYQAPHLKVIHLKPLGAVNLEEWAKSLSHLQGFSKLEYEILKANYTKN